MVSADFKVLEGGNFALAATLDCWLSFAADDSMVSGVPLLRNNKQVRNCSCDFGLDVVENYFGRAHGFAEIGG